jgi:hypothetical protein
MQFHKVTFYHRLDGAYHNFDTLISVDNILRVFTHVDNLIIYKLLPNNKKKRIYYKGMLTNPLLCV